MSELKNKTLNFNIKDINIHNALASLALLVELNLDIFKIKSKFENLEPSEGRGKNILSQGIKKISIYR